MRGRLEEFSSADPGFVPAFLARLTGKKIILKHTDDKAAPFNKSSFSADGDLMITFKDPCMNVPDIARDILNIL